MKKINCGKQRAMLPIIDFHCLNCAVSSRKICLMQNTNRNSFTSKHQLQNIYTKDQREFLGPSIWNGFCPITHRSKWEFLEIFYHSNCICSMYGTLLWTLIIDTQTACICVLCVPANCISQRFILKQPLSNNRRRAYILIQTYTVHTHTLTNKKCRFTALAA